MTVQLHATLGTAPRRGRAEAVPFFRFAVAGGGGLLLALAVIYGSAVSSTMWSLAVAALIGAVALVLVFVRFEWFLIALVCLRPSLDLLGAGNGTLDPAAVLGLVFLLAGGAWIVTQVLAGRRQPISPATVALVALAACGALSISISVDKAASAVAAIRVASGILMFGVLEQALPGNLRLLRRLFGAAFLGAIPPILMALWQMARPSASLQDGELSRVSGTFVHPNALAGFLVMVICAVVALWRLATPRQKAAGAVLAATASIALVGTYARAAWIALVLAVAFLLARRRPLYIFAIGALVVASAVLVPSISARFSDLGSAAPIQGVPSNSLSWRVGYWERLIALGRHNPVTGIGLETVQHITPEQLQPHNVWVQAFVEMGLVGLFATITAVICIALTVRRLERNAFTRVEATVAPLTAAVLLTLLVQSVTENLLTSTFVFWYAAVLGGFGFASRCQPSIVEDSVRSATAQCMPARARNR